MLYNMQARVPQPQSKPGEVGRSSSGGIAASAGIMWYTDTPMMGLSLLHPKQGWSRGPAGWFAPAGHSVGWLVGRPRDGDGMAMGWSAMDAGWMDGDGGRGSAGWAGQVLGPVEGQRRLPQGDGQPPLLGLEVPGQGRVHLRAPRCAPSRTKQDSEGPKPERRKLNREAPCRRSRQ